MEKQFLIRMKNGFYFHNFEDGRVFITLRLEEAAKFPTRLAALDACRQSPEFGYATIQECEATPSQSHSGAQ